MSEFRIDVVREIHHGDGWSFKITTDEDGGDWPVIIYCEQGKPDAIYTIGPPAMARLVGQAIIDLCDELEKGGK